MVGGDDEPVKRLEPVFIALAPEAGYAHVGPSGAGHFVKMVHNGIEYGLMQSYAEGFEIMEPLRVRPGPARDLWHLAERLGRRSWLLELLHSAFESHGSKLEDIAPYVEDSGEGRWTINEAINENVPAPVISASLFARFASRDEIKFSAQGRRRSAQPVRRARRQGGRARQGRVRDPGSCGSRARESAARRTGGSGARRTTASSSSSVLRAT